MAAEAFYFAWVDDTETTFDPVAHKRNDDSVFSFSFSQDEGDFASLVVGIKNPRVGLLAPGRKTWAWFSFFDGTDLTPLFFGRLTAIPDNIFDTVVTLKLTARPKDFVAQKTALAETMKVAPYYDSIFIAPDSWTDPDVVLEGYTRLWHIDPVTHVVTASDVLVGEDGTITVDPDKTFYDSLNLTLQQVPLSSVTVNATIPWTNSAQGDVDITNLLLYNYHFGDVVGRMIGSFTLPGLIQSWPQAGATLGDGWVVKDGKLDDQTLLAAKPITFDDYFDLTNIPFVAEGSIIYPPRYSGKTWAGVDGAGFDTQINEVVVPIGWGVPKLIVTYTANRKYGEVISFTMKSAMQAIATGVDDDEAAILNINANDVSEFTEDASLPIGDVSRPRFSDSERGLAAIEHLTQLAKTALAIRARAVKLSFQMDMKNGLAYTLRKNASLSDDRLPGGEALGKIISYSHDLDGDTGAPITTITVGCAIGYGGAYEAEEGDPTYVEDGYVEDGYQQRVGASVLIGLGDVTYSPPVYTPSDDGLDLSKGLSIFTAVKQLTSANAASQQRAALLGLDGADQAAVSAKLQDIPTQISLKLVPMGSGPFSTPVTVNVSDLIIPKQIDLEAVSG